MNINNFTIITVCKNEEKRIERTIKSILEQTNSEYEYIIKDGESNDKTLEIIKQYKYMFDEKRIPLTIHIKKDEGIYDAMNQAIPYIKGEWVIFLNAGDVFYDKNVLEDLSKKDICPDCVIVYGMTKYKLNGKGAFIVEETHEKILDGIGICHQSYFIKSNILKNRKYDTQFKLAADFDLLVELKKCNEMFQYVNMIISCYQLDGLSSMNPDIMSKESIEIRKKYLLPYKDDGRFIKFLKKIETWIRKICPYMLDIKFCLKKVKLSQDTVHR